MLGTCARCVSVDDQRASKHLMRREAASNRRGEKNGLVEQMVDAQSRWCLARVANMLRTCARCVSVGSQRRNYREMDETPVGLWRSSADKGGALTDRRFTNEERDTLWRFEGPERMPLKKKKKKKRARSKLYSLFLILQYRSD